MNSVDQIIEAYKRGLEDGRKENVLQGMPYRDWQGQRQRWPGDSTGNPPVDTSKITCEDKRDGVGKDYPSLSGFAAWVYKEVMPRGV